jgi:selT/selW/selH-like putative selenoprotein
MATRAAAELSGEFQVQPKMVRGTGGVFDVTLNGEPLYSKSKTGRFPVEGELTDLVHAKKAAKKA